MAIDIEKLTVPLGIVASVIAVYAFLRPGNTSTQVTGTLPQPLTVPTFAAQPIITSNVATPTPPATASSPVPAPAAATGTYSASAPYLPYNPPGGVIINFGAGAPTAALTQSTTGTNSAGQSSCCDPCGANRPKPVLSYARQISQSAVL